METINTSKVGTNYNPKEKKMMSKSHIRIMEVCLAKGLHRHVKERNKDSRQH